MRRPVAGSRARPFLVLRNGTRRFVEILVGGEAAGVARKGEAAEGVTRH